MPMACSRCTAVALVGEALVHVDVTVVEVQHQLRWMDGSGARRIPAIRRERLAVADRIALVAVAQRLVDEGARHFRGRVVGEVLQLATREERGVYAAGWREMPGPVLTHGRRAGS